MSAADVRRMRQHCVWQSSRVTLRVRPKALFNSRLANERSRGESKRGDGSGGANGVQQRVDDRGRSTRDATDSTQGGSYQYEIPFLYPETSHIPRKVGCCKSAHFRGRQGIIESCWSYLTPPGTETENGWRKALRS